MEHNKMEHNKLNNFLVNYNNHTFSILLSDIFQIENFMLLIKYKNKWILVYKFINNIFVDINYPVDLNKFNSKYIINTKLYVRYNGIEYNSNVDYLLYTSNVVSNLASNVVSNLNSTIVSNLDSTVVSNLASNVVSNLASNVVSNLDSTVVSDVASNVVSGILNKLLIANLYVTNIYNTLQLNQFINSHMWYNKHIVLLKNEMLNMISTQKKYYIIDILLDMMEHINYKLDDVIIKKENIIVYELIRNVISHILHDNIQFNYYIDRDVIAINTDPCLIQLLLKNIIEISNNGIINLYVSNTKEEDNIVVTFIITTLQTDIEYNATNLEYKEIKLDICNTIIEKLKSTLVVKTESISRYNIYHKHIYRFDLSSIL